MRKLHQIILSGVVAPCKTSPPGILRKLHVIQIPIIYNKHRGSPVDSTSYASLHDKNKSLLKKIYRQLKKEHLQKSHIDELVDTQSQTYQAYCSLVRLYKINVINNRYLKEKNISGLRTLSELLNTIIEE